MPSDGAPGSTTLPERVRAAERVTPVSQRRRSDRSTAAYAALATLTTALAILFRSGYTFGLYDQWVHSLRGIALGDPGAFVGDWFARSVPQPHWLFDAVTFLGTRLGILPGVYLVYWLAGIAAFAVASVWLVDHFLPGHRALSLALGPLVALGPQAVLGSTTPLLWFAIPHMLGGCLAFLALAALLTGRWRWAATAALAAAAFHVQHGANLAPVLLLAALVGRQAPRRHRILLVVAAGAVLRRARAGHVLAPRAAFRAQGRVRPGRRHRARPEVRLGAGRRRHHLDARPPAGHAGVQRARRPNVEFHRYDAGHAFSNWDAPSMYDRAAAEEAWARTLEFFSRHLPPLARPVYR